MSLLAEVVRVDEIRYFWDAYGFEGVGQRELVDCDSLKKERQKTTKQPSRKLNSIKSIEK